MTFFDFDLAVGLHLPLVFAAGRYLGLIGADTARWYWCGCIVGALWEYPLHFAGPLYLDDPVYAQNVAFPVHPMLQPLVHSLWDGLIFLVGRWLLLLLRMRAALLEFTWPALGVLVAWGQGQSWLVELSASGGSGWHYVPRWWNPALISAGGTPVTLLPHLIWLVAPWVHYRLVLWSAKRSNEG